MKHLLYALGFVGLAVHLGVALGLLTVVGTADIIIERLNQQKED